MKRDWRKDPTVIAVERALRKRRRELFADPMYVVEEERLKRVLGKYYLQNPQIISDFFRRFSSPLPSKLKNLEAFLASVQDPTLRKTFREYFQFASRFRVVFSPQKGSFETLVDLPNPTKFHVKIEGGHVTGMNPTDTSNSGEDSLASVADESSARVRFRDCPAADGDDDPIEVSFASEQLEVPPALAQAIESGQAKVVQIDDTDGSSCLSAIEQVCSAETVTFVRHNAEQKYLLLAIGASVTTEQLRELGPAITAVRSEDLGRGKAGRPVDLQKRELGKKLLKKRSGSLKEKAFALTAEAPNLKTQQSYLSRLKKEQQKD